MNYYERARALATRNTDPTLTDQSGARDTDINVIVKRMGVGGTLPGNTQQPMYADFTQLPRDLRGFLETAASLKEHQAALPDQLKQLPLDQLLNLTPQELAHILNPAPKQEAPKRENPPPTP